MQHGPYSGLISFCPVVYIFLRTTFHVSCGWTTSRVISFAIAIMSICICPIFLEISCLLCSFLLSYFSSIILSIQDAPYLFPMPVRQSVLSQEIHSFTAWALHFSSQATNFSTVYNHIMLLKWQIINGSTKTESKSQGQIKGDLTTWLPNGASH